MDRFARLPEGCISHILSLTSPLDTVRSSSVSKRFKSAADSDAVWQSFLPSDYQEIISRSNPPIHYSNSTLSQKQLYSMLCDSPFLIDGGDKSFSLDKRSGKKKYLVCAREPFVETDNSQAWERKSHHNSRFSQVISLNDIYWLEIKGRIETQMLSQKTNYAAYLVFSLEEGHYGFECAVDSVIRFIDCDYESESESEGEGEGEGEGERKAENIASSTTIYLQQPEARGDFMSLEDQVQVPRSRADGWMEVEMGSFYNEHGDEGIVEARLMENLGLHGKSGLIVEGFEFRPKCI